LLQSRLRFPGVDRVFLRRYRLARPGAVDRAELSEGYVDIHRHKSTIRAAELVGFDPVL